MMIQIMSMMIMIMRMKTKQRRLVTSPTMPAKAPLRVIRKLHFPSPTRCHRNWQRIFCISNRYLLANFKLSDDDDDHLGENEDGEPAHGGAQDRVHDGQGNHSPVSSSGLGIGFSYMFVKCFITFKLVFEVNYSF